jgi:hypothetical protein
MEPEGLPASAYQAWHTVLQMLEDRHYNVPLSLLQVTEAEFNDNYTLREQMALHLLHRVNPLNQLRVIFIDRRVFADGTIRVSNIPRLLTMMGERPGTYGLFVLTHDVDITHPAKKVLDEINDDKQTGLIQWFTEEELSVNAVRAQRKARGIHAQLETVLPPGIKESHVQRIYVYERLARYFNAQAGDIISITRNSETGGLVKNYRRCVASPDRNDIKHFM